MKNNRIISIFVILVLTGQAAMAVESAESPPAAQDSAGAESVLEIQLSQEVTIDTNTISLGQVGIIKGGSADSRAAAEKIQLGFFSTPGQRITIDRQTILGRLAANPDTMGIAVRQKDGGSSTRQKDGGSSTSMVSLKGASQVTVSRDQIISGCEFVKQAIAILKKMPAYSSAKQYYTVRTPADLVIYSGAKEIKLVPHLSENNTTALARVEFVVLADGREIGRREVCLRLIRIAADRKKDNEKQFTAAEQVQGDKEEMRQAGSTSSPQAGGVKFQVVDIAEEQGKKDLPAQARQKNGGSSTGTQQVVINRNQAVSIKINSGGLQVSASGKALQRGCAGEKIKVQNIDSNRIIVAKINEDGSVEPVF
jgi:hypothetical protein